VARGVGRGLAELPRHDLRGHERHPDHDQDRRRRD
jgi:hypothetical protein